MTTKSLSLKSTLSRNHTLLRPHEPEDYEDFGVILNDPKTMTSLQHYFQITHWTPELVKRRFELIHAEQSEGLTVSFTVIHGLDHKIVGSCGFKNISRATKSAEFGLILHHTTWGKGIAKECFLLCLNFGFQQLHLDKVFFTTDHHNIRMQNFFRKFGIPRTNANAKGEDILTFEVGRQDWGLIRHRMLTPPISIYDPVYGTIKFEGIIAELLQSVSLHRLKGIRQGGAAHLAFSNLTTSRYDHSVGVCHLARICGASIEEQIAGLLHDISHTAFSHVVDHVFENSKEDFHELHKDRFFDEPTLTSILNSYGLSTKHFKAMDVFSIVEKELPALCADRIDYILRDAVHFKWITRTEVLSFLKTLHFNQGEITVGSLESARWFKKVFDQVVVGFFKHPKNMQAHLHLSNLLKRALQEGVLVVEDFFRDDNWIEQKTKSHFKYKQMWEDLETSLHNSNDWDSLQIDKIKMKDRSIDPMTFENGTLRRLSTFNKD